MFVPEKSPNMKDSLFQTNPQKLSQDFIKRCAGDNFNVPANDQFCRDAVFSLTTACNNDVKECGCHVNGSQSTQCNDFGGQCECFPNIIGRTCSQCKMGYYGFPNCKRKLIIDRVVVLQILLLSFFFSQMSTDQRGGAR